MFYLLYCAQTQERVRAINIPHCPRFLVGGGDPEIKEEEEEEEGSRLIKALPVSPLLSTREKIVWQSVTERTRQQLFRVGVACNYRGAQKLLS